MARRILVVEDETKIREIFAKFLTSRGHQVDEARDGQEAVEKAGRQTYDLIMMDVKMPRLDGISALKRIRDISPSTKVVLLTGYRVDDQIGEVVKDGVECLQKPVLLKDIDALVAGLGPSGRPSA